MCLDVGDSRVGVALSDPLGILATPLTIVNRAEGPAALKQIEDIVRGKTVEKIIVGLPLNMDGSRGEQAEKTAQFAGALKGYTDVPLEYHDERLSTVTARGLIKKVRKTDRATRYDAAAAALLLQSYLDEKNPPTAPGEIPPPDDR